MIPAAIPNNEKQRLEALDRYRILDTEAEQEFDDVVKLASQICNVPISLISLIDKDRQWFKARVGLAAPETHRNLAFCAHVVAQDAPLVVPDATKDERFFDNPLVTGSPDIRFYAGFPLSTPDGFNLGTLCVIDTVARELSQEQAFAVQTLANQIIKQFELKLKIRALEEQNQTLENTIAELKNAQMNLVKSEKMASIGQLTAGIAHEINNPINFVYAGSELLKSMIDDLKKDLDKFLGNPQSVSLQEIQGNSSEIALLSEDIFVGAKRVSEIVKDLRLFARLDEDGYKNIDIHKNLEILLKIVGASANPSINWIKDFLDKKIMITCSVKDFNHALVNIFNNAVDAVGECDSKNIYIKTSLEDNFLIISIKDSGIGISNDIKEKIFEPFFTTKSIGKGVGLGLSIAKTIVEAHEGKILIENSTNFGTEVKIYLPVQEK